MAKPVNRLIRTFALVVGLLGALGCFPQEATEREAPAPDTPVTEPRVIRPRVVLLLSLDTLRADHLGFYGYEKFTSPVLDMIAAEGVVGSYIHAGGRIGVLLEVNCETDFVSRNEDFQGFVKDVCMHIAAAGPIVVDANELDGKLVAKQHEIFKAQAMEEGKPEHIAEKIVEGRVRKCNLSSW